MGKVRRASTKGDATKSPRKSAHSSQKDKAIPSGSGRSVSKNVANASFGDRSLLCKSGDDFDGDKVVNEASGIDLDDSMNLMTEGIHGLCRGSKKPEDSPLCLTPTLEKGAVAASDLMEALKRMQDGDGTGLHSDSESEGEDDGIPDNTKRQPPLLDAEAYLLAEEEEGNHFRAVAQLRSGRLWQEPKPCPRKAKRLADQLRDTQKYFRRRVMLAHALKDATKNYKEALSFMPSEPHTNIAYAVKVCNRQRKMYGRYVKSYANVSELRLKAMMAYAAHQKDLSRGAIDINEERNAKV